MGFNREGLKVQDDEKNGNIIIDYSKKPKRTQGPWKRELNKGLVNSKN